MRLDILIEALSNEEALQLQKLLALKFPVQANTTKPATKPVLTQEEMDQAEIVGVVTAIRMIRERTGIGLVEAKRLVDAHLDKIGKRR